MTMESAMLKEIVLPPTLMRKLLNVAGVSGLVSLFLSLLCLSLALCAERGEWVGEETDIGRIQAPTTAPLAAPIPWRKQGVRHSNNEIYFDIAESLDAIVDK